MKKILSLILAAMMIVSACAVSFAEAMDRKYLTNILPKAMVLPMAKKIMR